MRREQRLFDQKVSPEQDLIAARTAATEARELGAYLLTEAGLDAYVLDRPKAQDAAEDTADNTEQG